MKRLAHLRVAALTRLFGICVVALYFASRHIKIASGDGSYRERCAALLCLAVLQAVQVVLAFSFFGDKWSRPYYLGLDVAVDAGLFALCFGYTWWPSLARWHVILSP